MSDWQDLFCRVFGSHRWDSKFWCTCVDSLLIFLFQLFFWSILEAYWIDPLQNTYPKYLLFPCLAHKVKPWIPAANGLCHKKHALVCDGGKTAWRYDEPRAGMRWKQDSIKEWQTPSRYIRDISVMRCHTSYKLPAHDTGYSNIEVPWHLSDMRCHTLGFIRNMRGATNLIFIIMPSRWYWL